MVESFSTLNLTPNDWQQLCHAVLSGGDYLLWRGEYQENCKQTAQLNALVGQAQRNLDMLTEAGTYADLQQQILYDPGVFAQIAAAPLKLGRPYLTNQLGISYQKFYKDHLNHSKIM